MRYHGLPSQPARHSAGSSKCLQTSSVIGDYSVIEAQPAFPAPCGLAGFPCRYGWVGRVRTGVHGEFRSALTRDMLPCPRSLLAVTRVLSLITPTVLAKLRAAGDPHQRYPREKDGELPGHDTSFSLQSR